MAAETTARALTAALRTMSGLALLLAACSDVKGATGSARQCTLDAECGAGAYCTPGRVCRLDCYTDVDCLALGAAGADGQCNRHGRCVYADLPSADAGPDAKPTDAPSDFGKAGDAPLDPDAKPLEVGP